MAPSAQGGAQFSTGPAPSGWTLWHTEKSSLPESGLVQALGEQNYSPARLLWLALVMGGVRMET